MTKYTRMDGQTLELGELSAENRAHFDRCYQAYRDGMDVHTFEDTLVYGTENPHIRESGGWVTQPIDDSVPFQATRDLGAVWASARASSLPREIGSVTL